MSNGRRIRLLTIACGLLVSGALQFLLPTPHARADTQPRLSTSGDHHQLVYTAASSKWTSATNMSVFVYFPAGDSNGVIRITNRGCSGSGSIRMKIDGVGDNIVRRCGDGGISYPVNIAGSAIDPKTGHKIVGVSVSYTGGWGGAYRFEISSPRGLVRAISGQLTSYDHPYGSYQNNTYGNYMIPFGSDCSITNNSGEWRRITLVDPDNYLGSTPYGDQSAQGWWRGGANYSPVQMQAYVHAIPRNGGGAYRIDASDYGYLDNAVSGGSGQGYYVVPLGSTRDTSSESSFSIRMRPDYRYQLHIVNMKTNNTIQIRLPTDSIYYDVSCANWKVRGESYVENSTTNTGNKQGQSAVTAKPGDRLIWDHDLRNVGDYDMQKNIKVEVDHTNVDIGSSPGPSGNIIPNPGPIGYARGNVNEVFYKAYDVPFLNQAGRLVSQADVGKKVCQRISWQPESSRAASNSWGTAQWACADVPYSYNLRPTISVTGSSLNEGDGSVEGVQAGITNDGPTRSDKANLAVIRFVVKDNEATDIPGGEDVKVPYDPASPGNLISDWPCEIAKQIGSRLKLNINATGCTDGGLIRDGSGTIVETSGKQLISGGNNDISGLNLRTGDRLCYTTIVSSYNTEKRGAKDVFRYAKPACLSIAKKPKVQFWGGDVRSDADVVTSATYRHPVYYGSWAEYAVMAAGEARSSSGAGLSSTNQGREGLAGALPQAYNTLTFANTPNLGGFATMGSTTPPAFLNGGGPISGDTVNLNNLASGVYTRTGDLTISGGELGSGKRITIRSTGIVTISDNIVYSGETHQRVASVPQLTIIAQNIIIKDNVTELSGWLIAQGSGANGYISTCNAVVSANEYASDLSSDVCGQILKVNGPVIANHLYLRRTHGANAEHSGLPAEIFNLRPDVYLGSYGNTLNTGAIKTTYMRELPPRF